MADNFPPVVNPDNNDLNNDLFESIKVPECDLKLDYKPVKSIILLLTALLLFSCMDITVKYLAMRYNAPLVVAVRYIVHCLLMLIILAPSQGRKLFQTKRTGLVLIRATCLMLASIGVSSALKLLPVAETTAIVFLAPMLVMLIARPFLGERIGLLGWAAAIVGFSGVLLIVRPSNGLDITAILYLILGVAGNVFYQLLSRYLANTERTVAMLFYAALIGAVVLGIALPWHWYGEEPDVTTVLLFLSVGVTGGVGHFLYTKAFVYAPASILAPINYIQLLWAGLLGWLVFDHIPDTLSTIGLCVVAASGVLIAMKSMWSK